MEVFLNHSDLCDLLASPTSGLSLANDHGGYVCTSPGDGQVIKYFKGMDPNKDEDYWERTREVFGGDDLGMDLPEIREQMANLFFRARIHQERASLVIDVTDENISFTFSSVPAGKERLVEE